jgi:CubicO group peptidase (beta-lactamase class C family)
MLPELADTMRPTYRDVTLLQLLAHRAGFPTVTVPRGTNPQSWHLKTEPLPQQRMDYVKACLSQEPVYPPGTKMVYANPGYVVAGAIAERLTGQSWEELMTQRLFEPLGMGSVTFGTRDANPPQEPWPHILSNGRSVAVVKNTDMDLPTVIGPAGLARCSLEDWGKYARFWLQGLREPDKSRGKTELLRPETFRILTTPPDSHTQFESKTGGVYASGWRPIQRKWSGGTVFWHSGTNGNNCSYIIMAPHENFAVLVASNRGASAQACEDVATALVDELVALHRNPSAPN